MSEVVNHFSTRVGKTKVFMKATFAYTLHRIAEITEDHWVRRLQRVVRKYLAMGARDRENARQRYRALLEAANAALAASRHTRPRRRANLAAETSIAGFKRRLDNLSLGPAANIYSGKLESILLEVNSKMDSMMEQCKRIKKAELGIERAESERIKKDIERLKSNTGSFRLSAEPTYDMQGLPTREELDSPQLLYKFTRHMERQIGEAESLSRALGDALEERRLYQAK
jgi:myosin heavy subunit